jgi:hypothetical protein
MLHYHPPHVFAQSRDYWREVNEVRAAQESTSHDGLLMEANLAALAEDEPEVKVALLLHLAEVATEFAEAVHEQTDALNAEEDEPKAKGGK